jgi:hypothetical protein
MEALAATRPLRGGSATTSLLPIPYSLLPALKPTSHDTS